MAQSTANGSQRRRTDDGSQRRLPLADLEVLAWGTKAELYRPCVDCGKYTGRYCDYCIAAARLPKEKWCKGQHTPLCSTCDNSKDACHFCRGEPWVTPLPWR